MRKKFWKQLLMILVAAFVLLIPGQSIAADTSTVIYEIDGVPDYGACADGSPDCMEERNHTVSTAPFLQQSFLSLDSEIAAQELNKDYVKYLWNSANTVMGDYIDFFRGETFIMVMYNVITNLLESIGLVLTTFVMILYNLTSSSFITTIISSILDMIDTLVFQWQDPESWIYKLIIIFAMIGFVTKLVANNRRIIGISGVINVLGEVVLSGFLIIAVGIYGRPVVNFADNMINELISVTFDFGEDTDEPMEIRNKDLLFETLQMQSFKIRHFGSLEISDVEYEDKYGEIIYVSAEERLNDLLVDQTWQTAWREYDEYGNESISHNTSSCLQVMFLSFIFILHRILLAIIYCSFCLVIGLLKLLKELSLAAAVYQMIYTLLKGRNAQQGFWWVQQRLQWIVLCMVGNIVFTSLLFLMSKVIGIVSAVHPLAMIGLDILLLALVILLIKVLPGMLSNISKSSIQGVLAGNIDPRSFYNNITGNKNRKNREETETESEPYDQSDFDDSKDLADYTEAPPAEVSDINDDEDELVETINGEAIEPSETVQIDEDSEMTETKNEPSDKSENQSSKDEELKEVSDNAKEPMKEPESDKDIEDSIKDESVANNENESTSENVDESTAEINEEDEQVESNETEDKESLRDDNLMENEVEIELNDESEEEDLADHPEVYLEDEDSDYEILDESSASTELEEIKQTEASEETIEPSETVTSKEVDKIENIDSHTLDEKEQIEDKSKDADMIEIGTNEDTAVNMADIWEDEDD